MGGGGGVNREKEMGVEMRNGDFKIPLQEAYEKKQQEENIVAMREYEI